MSALRRGEVVRSETLPGAQLWVVISNDERNQALGTVVVARIAPVVKAQTATVVPLGAHDPFTGYVLTDFVTTEPAANFSPSGRLTIATVEAVSAALRVALP